MKFFRWEKINFVGPDGCKKNTGYNIKKVKPYFSNRQYGGGSVMVWGAFAGNRLLLTGVIDTKINEEKY